MANNSLSKTLKDKRKLKGLTLRQVEKETGISNGYLNLLERGKVSQPSPKILTKLAEFYGINPLDVLESAGYINNSFYPTYKTKREKIAYSLNDEPLTNDEYDEMVNYLKYLRSKSTKK